MAASRRRSALALVVLLFAAVVLADPYSGQWFNVSRDVIAMHSPSWAAIDPKSRAGVAYYYVESLQQTHFMFDFPQVPASKSPYYLEVELRFEDIFDEFIVGLDTANGKTFQYVVKEKAQRLVIVLQDGLQSYNGWAASDVKCAMFGGNFTANKLLFIKTAIKIYAASSPSTWNCDHPLGGGIYTHYNPPEARLILQVIITVIILVVAALLCCGCTIRFIRIQIQRFCKAWKPMVSDSFPAEVVVASASAFELGTVVPDPSFGSDEQVPAGGHTAYAFPVMTTPSDGMRYALVPVNESA